MSPSLVTQRLKALGFPRVSGDEPVIATIPSSGMVFSPRERG